MPTAAPLPQIQGWQLELDGLAVGGLAVAPDGGVAVSVGGASASGAGVVRLDPGGARRWEISLGASAGPCAFAGDQVVVATHASDALALPGGAMVATTGSPGAVVVALDDTTGAVRWHRGVGATGWVTAAALRALPDGGTVVGGSFTGTLRLGDQVVTSAGSSDGFVARLGADGAVAWLLRVGGLDADAVTALDGDIDAVVVGGSFTREAELHGQQLLARAPTSPYADGFVALVDPATGRPRWLDAFGGVDGDSVAAVVLTPRAVSAVVAIRGETAFGNTVERARGDLATAIATWERAASGGPTDVRIIDGEEVRPTTASAAGAGLVLGGSFRGDLALGANDRRADGTDAWLAISSGDGLDGQFVSGAGRDEVVAVAVAGGALALALHHTAAVRLGTAEVTAPVDPGGATTIVVGNTSLTHSLP